MEPQNGPWPLMGLIGAVLGVALSLGEYFLVGWLRRVAPLPLAVVGWLAIAIALLGIGSILVGLVTGKDPTGMSLVFVFVGVLLLAAVGGLAAMHFKRDGVPYPQACGHLMAQFGSAILLCYGLAQVLPHLAAFLHGGKPTDDGIVHWFPPVHFAGDWFYGTFLVVLVLLEVFRPFRHLLTRGS